jgi:hypothetical protein
MSSRKFSSPQGKFGGLFAYLFLIGTIIYESIFHLKRLSKISKIDNGDGSSDFIVIVEE